MYHRNAMVLTSEMYVEQSEVLMLKMGNSLTWKVEYAEQSKAYFRNKSNGVLNIQFWVLKTGDVGGGGGAAGPWHPTWSALIND